MFINEMREKLGFDTNQSTEFLNLMKTKQDRGRALFDLIRMFNPQLMSEIESGELSGGSKKAKTKKAANAMAKLLFTDGGADFLTGGGDEVQEKEAEPEKKAKAKKEKKPKKDAKPKKEAKAKKEKKAKKEETEEEEEVDVEHRVSKKKIPKVRKVSKTK